MAEHSEKKERYINKFRNWLDEIENDGLRQGKQYACQIANTEERENAYHKGLNEIWQMMAKLTEYPGDLTANMKRFESIFGCTNYYDLFHKLTPGQALAYMEDYELKQDDGCPFCKDGKMRSGIKLNDIISENALGYTYYGDGGRYIEKFRFCPICGEKLKEDE